MKSSAKAPYRSVLDTVLIIIGVLGPLTTFVIAISSIDDNLKLAALSAIAVFSSAVCLWLFFASRKDAASLGTKFFDDDKISDELNAILSEPDDELPPNALSDPLTGLANERAFEMVAEHQLAECHRSRADRKNGFCRTNRRR
ncbi:MAG: hypothetical protein LC730_00435 [Acidobacteria bacterium]|nr:hypothetical protein [Acidobacteriota bacterium]